jgi:hypothetical protein
MSLRAVVRDCPSPWLQWTWLGWHDGGVEKRRSDQRRPEDIIGEWGIRDVTPPSAAERTALAAEHELNPLVGKALPRRIRAFGAQAHTYLASLAGPPLYMQRARLIDEETERHQIRLAEAYELYRDDPAEWRRIAERWNFTEVNDLIERHNTWYPVEARLPMNPRTRDYVEVGGRPYRREPLDARWILEQFP